MHLYLEQIEFKKISLILLNIFFNLEELILNYNYKLITLLLKLQLIIYKQN